MYLLVCNAGSTSLKFKLFEMPAEKVLAEAKVERIGRRNNGIFTYKNPVCNGERHLEKVDRLLCLLVEIEHIRRRKI